jgi:hypothetical protein
MCVYRVYGDELSREVTFLSGDPVAVRIPPDADWVIVDRPWNVAWGHPEFTDMGKLILMNKGTPSPEELALLERLVANPDFEPVFISPSRAQAVFRRRR